MQVPRICQNAECGKAFIAEQWQVAKGAALFCSYHCASLARANVKHPPIFAVCQNPLCGKDFRIRPSVRAAGRGIYCSWNCYRVSMAKIALWDRFWAKVQRCTHEPWCVFCCWPWIGSRHSWGYGRISVTMEGKQRLIRANRLAWELFQGRHLPEDMWALHYCDFPPCCNPAHIYPGTAIQNSQDAVKRGRLIGRYHGTGHRGEKTPNARLKAQDIPLIWILRTQGETLRSIANRFNVSVGAITAVLDHRTWTHVSLNTNAEESEAFDL